MAKSAIEVAELLYLAILVLLILTGNSLVILAFHLGSRRLRTYTNYFVVNLAVCDLMVGILSVPLWMYVRIDVSAFYNRNFYKAFLAFDVLFGCSSILSLTVISLERMVAVKYPARHFNLTRKPVLLAIASIWVVGCLFSALSLQFGRSKEFTTLVFVLGFILPAVITFVSYVIIFRIARETACTSRKIIKEVKVAKMVSIIVSLFMLCWLPFFIMNMLYLYCTDWCKTIPYYLFLVTKVLHYSNSMMNVVVYAVRSPDFRNAFQSLISHKCKRMKSGSDVALRNFRNRTLTDADSQANAKERNGQASFGRAGSIAIEKRREGSVLAEKFRSSSRVNDKLFKENEAVKVQKVENDVASSDP